jgi:metallo-beta-lactamase family protein
MAQITFLGAAETVTGSKYLLEAGKARVLVDCGLFQGLKELRERNWQPLPFPPAKVQSVILTHAHVDHVGYLPRFVKDGFAGPVYSTPPTEDLAELILLDSAKNEMQDAEYANRKGFSKHRPALPLFDTDDVKRAIKRFRTVRRGDWFAVSDPIWARYHDAGHLLGSSMIEIEIRDTPAGSTGKPLRLLFSGDVGRYNAPLYYDPAPPPECDYLICESTYGDRDHPAEDVRVELAREVNAAIARGGVMLMAAFAVGRAEQLIYLLQILMADHRIPEFPIYLDSPMAVSGWNIYGFYAGEHDLSEGLALDKNYTFDLRHVKLARSVQESKQINEVEGPAMIISSSGMMTGGRILHHLVQRLPDPRNTVLLGGYMAEGTRGRTLQQGAQRLRVFGRDVPVRATVVEMSGLSGHAGRSELLRWLAPLAAPRRVFLTHGEKSSSLALADELKRTRGWNTVVPRMGEAFQLDGAAEMVPERTLAPSDDPSIGRSALT